MTQNVAGYTRIPFIFATSFFHSILDLRLTSLSSRKSREIVSAGSTKKPFRPNRRKRFFYFTDKINRIVCNPAAAGFVF